MAMQVSDLMVENQRLAADCKLLNSAKELWHGDESDQVLFNTQKLITRIEELEDLVVELKTKHSPQEVLELKSLINSQANEISVLKDKYLDASRRRFKAIELFDKNDLNSSFQKVIKERDDVIKSLQGQLKDALQNA